MPTVPAEPLDLNLRPGETIQVQFVDDETRAQHYVKVIGYLPDRSLLVTTPTKGGKVLLAREGRAAVVRTFSGQHAQGFTSAVLKQCNQPFDYLHLAYPQKIEQVKVRESARVRSAIAVGLRTAAGADVPAVIRDLSTSGAQVLAADAVGAVGDVITIRARLSLETVGDQAIDLPARIRNAQEEADVPGSLWRHRYGVEFEPQDLQSRLVLRAYLYERATS